MASGAQPQEHVVGLFIQAKATCQGSRPQQKMGPTCACQDGGPGTPGEGRGGVWVDVNYVLFRTSGGLTSERGSEYFLKYIKGEEKSPKVDVQVGGRRREGMGWTSRSLDVDV